jgi:hypothetical protein
MALPIRRTNDVPDTARDNTPPTRWDPPRELEQLNRRLAGYLDLWRQVPVG